MTPQTSVAMYIEHTRQMHLTIAQVTEPKLRSIPSFGYKHMDNAALTHKRRNGNKRILIIIMIITIILSSSIDEYSDKRIYC